MDFFNKDNEDNAVELATDIMEVVEKRYGKGIRSSIDCVEFMVALTYLLAYICDTMTKSGLKEDKLRIAEEFIKLVKSKIECCSPHQSIFH